MTSFGLPLARVRWELHALQGGLLPGYAGSALRGAMAAAYKRVVCVVSHRHCPICHLRTQCTYPLIFEPPPRDDDPLLRSEGVPPAFVVRPPPVRDWVHLRPQPVRPGRRWSFELVLFGPSVQQFPLLLYAVQEALSRGLGRRRIPFEIHRVFQVYPSGLRRPLFSRKTGQTRPPRMVCLRPPRVSREVRRVRLRFVAPFRVKQGGRYRFDAHFATLLAALLRRLSRLGTLYGQGPVAEYRDLLAQARDVQTVRQDLRWVDWQRYSRRQATAMQLGGWVGDLVFEGPLTPLWGWLRLGELVHVGKNTAFGLGRYLLSRQE